MVNKNLRNTKLPINHHPSTTNWGYTLIEILVGITILGILFSLGTASYREFARRQAVAGASKLIVGDIRFAQTKALAGEKPSGAVCNDPQVLQGYRFQVLSDNIRYRILAQCSGGTITIKTVSLPENILFDTLPSPNPILFKALGDGTNISGSTTMTISVAGLNPVTITVTSGGTVR